LIVWLGLKKVMQKFSALVHIFKLFKLTY